MNVKYFSYAGTGRIYGIKLGPQPKSFVGVGAVSKCVSEKIPAYYCIPIYSGASPFSSRKLSSGYYTIDKLCEKWIVAEYYLLNAKTTIDIGIPKKSKTDLSKQKKAAQKKQKKQKQKKQIPKKPKVKRPQKDNSVSARSERLNQYLASVGPDPWYVKKLEINEHPKEWTGHKSNYWGENSVHAFQGGGCTPK